MALGPGPRQRAPSNIIRISFPAIGGLVFFRAAQRWDGGFLPIAPKATVTGLPWGTFDLFTAGDKVDPNGTPKGEQVSISNPVTDNMLSKYLYWSHYTPKSVAQNSSIPPTDFYVVDLANFTQVYNGIITSRVYTLSTRDEALAYFKGPGLVGAQDPNLVGVTLADNLNQEIVVNPPSATFWAGVNQGGWTYHIEQIPGATIYKQDDAAIVVFNLAKLFRDVPNASNGKKPAQIAFKVAPPVKPPPPVPNVGARLQWWLQAGAYKSKLSDPVKTDERRDFPVEDRQVPIDGIPGAFDTNYLSPTWDFPDFAANVEAVEDWADGEEATVTITFGAGNVAPKVEIEFVAGGGVEVG